jgi:hypothetical protein
MANATLRERSIAPRSRSVPQGYVHVTQLNLLYNDFLRLNRAVLIPYKNITILSYNFIASNNKSR